MRFLQKNKKNKTVLVISDLHLGAGKYLENNFNCLEDFHFDKELVEFFTFFCTGEYSSRDVELIINGDFLDFLAVPYVKHFDDEFWSESASLAKLDLILKAHKEVFISLNDFVSKKNKKLTYILGNHDIELVLEKVRKNFLDIFDDINLERVDIIFDNSTEYRPIEKVVIKHGHEYEIAHSYSHEKIVRKDKNGEDYILPPWGSYYVTRVINRFKPERHYINAVRPIKRFIINGLIYDTVFTLRFLLSTCVYFIMVRVLSFFQESHSLNKLIQMVKEDLDIFKNYEEITQDYFESHEDVDCLIMGHTHEPVIKNLQSGKTFINTGTWTNMYNLDFGHTFKGSLLTYAQIDQLDSSKNKEKMIEVNLNIWKGTSRNPFDEYR